MPMRCGSTPGLVLQELRAGHHVLILRGAGGARVIGMMEGVAVADAEPIVDRQHDEAVSREILVHGVGVAVVIHVVPAEQHLPRRAAVDEDDAGFVAVRARALEELSVHGQAVGGLETSPVWASSSRGSGKSAGRGPVSRSRRAFAVRCSRPPPPAAAARPRATNATSAAPAHDRCPFEIGADVNGERAPRDRRARGKDDGDRRRPGRARCSHRRS